MGNPVTIATGLAERRVAVFGGVCQEPRAFSSLIGHQTRRAGVPAQHDAPAEYAIRFSIVKEPCRFRPPGAGCLQSLVEPSLFEDLRL